MKRFVTVFAMVATFAWAGAARAQGFAFGAHAGWSNPLGAYEDDFGADAAGARPGFTLGVDATYPLPMRTDNLGWYSSLSLIRNRTEGSQDRTGGLVSGAFTLVPVMTGLRYDIGTLPSLFFTAQGGPCWYGHRRNSFRTVVRPSVCSSGMPRAWVSSCRSGRP